MHVSNINVYIMVKRFEVLRIGMYIKWEEKNILTLPAGIILLYETVYCQIKYFNSLFFSAEL